MAQCMLVRLSSTSQSLGEAVGRASQYLPALSLRRRGASAAKPPPPPPPLPVWVHMLSDEQRLVEATAETSLEQLQQECERAAGVPAAQQRVCVQGALGGRRQQSCGSSAAAACACQRALQQRLLV